MSIPTNIARLPTNPIMISLLVSISTVVGCGVMPAGQGNEQEIILMRATGPSPSWALRLCLSPWFTLARRMLFGSLVLQLPRRVPGIIDVLERQGRSALLPDAVISVILSHLVVDISYTPMNCPMVTGPEEMHRAERGMAKTYCIIVGNTVTGICTVAMQRRRVNGKCNMPMNGMVTVTAFNGTHLTISGTLSTTNIIMANWSRMMWQSVVDRAVRMLTLGPFGTHFVLARATVGGN
ncbi:hypothetical protein KIN20_030151 [Parelaphostrongylus tenuis]|uniref:Uncharacterized protein n=1 Tax=Parelaphostrongylus tenuis TaxID=148309 RepID=A0AAD5R486_PARTN|nr:hypothetical protein KIN20_030151 [Parelaphostrongylus tenuis]